jgi:hypothetical protein
VGVEVDHDDHQVVARLLAEHQHVLVVAGVDDHVAQLLQGRVPAAAEAIYTTTASGLTVNANLYPSKADVYLSGGPQNCNQKGFDDGIYYFEVSNPSTSALLSTDAVGQRKVQVSGGVISSYLGNTHLFITGGKCGSIGVQLIPFDNTPNPGGEYKLTLVAACAAVDETGTSLDALSACSHKSDNFKVKEACIGDCVGTPQATLSGVKFYDGNKNGVLDPQTEGPVQGVKITLTSPGNPAQSLVTLADGLFSFVLPLNASFQICEDLTSLLPAIWKQTAPLNGASAGLGTATATAGCWNGTLSGDISDLYFGNVNKIKLSGTKFYDGNKNGVQDNGEAPVQGVTINFSSNGSPYTTALTLADGTFSVDVPLGVSFQVCEDKTKAPFTTGLWDQTAPLTGATAGSATADATKCWGGTSAADIAGLNFGNVAKIKGTKYYDTNKDGLPSGGEPTIDGFKVLFCADASCVGTPVYTGIALTANGGTYSFDLPTATSSFQVCEVVPNVSNPANSFWSQTGPLFPASPIGNTGTGSAASTALKCWSGSGTVSGLYLTNICFTRLSGGFTLGFWSNKNGQALITGADLAALTALNLRNADGSNFDPATPAALKTWLLSGNAVNMSYMLSVQMAATKLDTLHGLPASTLVDATAYGLGIISIADLITAADALLASDGNAISGNAHRAIQEKYKNVFDAINFTPVANPGTQASIFQVTAAYQDINNTFDPGGRVGEIVFRINW